jgi:outer membrane lipase/esterase
VASALSRAAFIALLVTAALPEAQVAADDGPPPPINRFVTFGDSLSDPGNAYVETGGFVIRPFAPVPAAPYLIGRFRFTNGPTWIEQLANAFRLPRSGRPALLRPGIYTNYAFGAARARLDGPFDLRGQLELFLDGFDNVAAPATLYVLWIGANDLRDAFEAFVVEMDPDRAVSILEEAIRATADSIQQLYAVGARSFLILNLPNIGDTPALRDAGPEARALGRQLAEGYNAGLELALDELDNLLSDIVIVPLDVFAILDEVVADPDLAGLKNVTDSCITPEVIIGAICRRPRKFLFWDFIHPTRTAHKYLSEQAQASLQMEFFIEESAFWRVHRFDRMGPR